MNKKTVTSRIKYESVYNIKSMKKKSHLTQTNSNMAEKKTSMLFFRWIQKWVVWMKQVLNGLYALQKDLQTAIEYV